MIFASLIAKLGFDTSGWTSGKATAVAGLKDYEAKQTSALQRIGQSFGRGSDLGRITRAIAGAGIVGGVVMLAKEVYALADAWTGASKAAEDYATAVKNNADTAKAVAEGKKTGDEAVRGLERQLRKAQEQNDLSFASPADAFAIKQKAHAAELDDQVKDFKDKVSDTRQQADDAQKEVNRIAEEIAGKKKLIEQNSIGHSGDAHLLDAVAVHNLKKDVEELAKKQDEALQKRAEFANKATAMEGSLAKQLDLIQKTKSLDANTAYGDELNAQAKAQKEANEKAVEMEKEKNRQLKELQEQAKADAISTLEDQRNAVQEQIRTLSQKHKAVETHAIRGDAGIVTQEQKDPNTQILKESRDHLKAIDGSIKSLRETKPEPEPVNVVNF